MKIQTMGTKARPTQTLTETDTDTHVAPLAMGRSKSRVAPSQSGVHVCFLYCYMCNVGIALIFWCDGWFGLALLNWLRAGVGGLGSCWLVWSRVCRDRYASSIEIEIPTGTRKSNNTTPPPPSKQRTCPSACAPRRICCWSPRPSQPRGCSCASIPALGPRRGPVLWCFVVWCWCRVVRCVGLEWRAC